jgi:ribosomal protein S18 acetylase RimI-like enzyme
MADPNASLRQASPRDAQAIAEIHRRTWHMTYRGVLPDEVNERMTAEYCAELWRKTLCDTTQTVLVAQEGSEVTGFVHGRRLEPEEDGCDFELLRLYVLPEFQRCGHGLMLVQALTAAFTARGARAIRIRVLSTNAAVHFYESLGATFVRSETVRAGGAEYTDHIYRLFGRVLDAPLL